MKRFYLTIAIVAAAVMSVSCEKENRGNNSQSANEIAFSIGTAVTKAGDETVKAGTYDLGFDNLVLEEEISSLDGLFYDAPATKGTPAYTDNLVKLYGSFKAVAFKPASNSIPSTPTLGDTSFGYDEDHRTWRHYYDVNPWTGMAEGEGYWFFMRMGDMTNVKNLGYALKDGKAGRISFSYQSPSAATSQEDILFASRFLTEEDEKDHDAKVLFYHALTGVKFKLDELGDNISFVKDIKLKGLYDKGTCVMTPYYGEWTGSDSNASGAADTRSAKCADWTLDKTHTFTAVASFTEAEGKGTAKGKSDYQFPSSFSAGDTAEKNFNDANFSKTFFLVPQVVDEDVVLEVSLVLKNGETVTREFAFGENVVKTNDWKAGELRTYTLKINGNIDIVVEEEFDEITKSDVYVKNIGTDPAYVRVILSANWVGTVKGQEMIVAPYEFFDDQSKMIGTWVNFPGTNWVKNGLYYYFTEPVGGGLTTTTPLFKSFTYTSDQAQIVVAGAHLEMAIASQAVPAVTGQTWKEAWGIE